MTKRILIFLLVSISFVFGTIHAQLTPWYVWTFLPEDQMDEIIGEASGETAWNTIMETGGYNKDRLSGEYKGTFYESQYIYDQLKQYGLPGAEIVRFPGGKVWDGIKGELWEIEPRRQKLASYRDMTAMLARGSTSADVKAELVWVGQGTEEEIERADIAGKIAVTEGNVYGVHKTACLDNGALGVVVISQSRPYFDPIQIPWRGLTGWRQSTDQTPKFGFFLPFRDGFRLKQRLLQGEKIIVHAQVETRMEPYDLQDVVCHIPGMDPRAGEIIFSAHLFEGIVKQGANDNKSGSAAILEVARVLHTLFEEGRLPRPRRTIRFLWGPEFSGTGPWVKANKKLMEKTLCNINMDMVGEWLSKNQAFMSLMRTSYGNPHYINDVMENYYRFMGEINRERLHAWGYIRRIAAPTGADEPFYYTIEPHFGASDHEVFNDWSVRVPGIMMIAWPDQWYHTSGDRVDKADPTQLKRTVIIGAAAAYTIANADEPMALRIAAEIAGNGSRRLGHQFTVSMEELNNADAENLNRIYHMAQYRIRAAVDNEIATLATVLELGEDKETTGDYIEAMQKTIGGIGVSHLAALETHANTVAERLNTPLEEVRWTDLEQNALKIVPKATARVTAGGYGAYEEYIEKLPKEQKEKYPYSRWGFPSIRELQLLIDGKNSVLDIKFKLDLQHERESDLQKIINYIQILKLAGLVEISEEK